MRHLIRRATALRNALRELTLLRPTMAGVGAMVDEVKLLSVQLNQKLDGVETSDVHLHAIQEMVRKIEVRVSDGARSMDQQRLALLQLYYRLSDRKWPPAAITADFSTLSANGATVGDDNSGWRGIAIISVPKSASTFLWHLLEQVSGSFQPRRILQTVAGRAVLPEADLLCAAVIRAEDQPTIVREHLLANANTLLFLQLSRLRPVILWRAVDDALVSLAEEWTWQWGRHQSEIEREGYHAQFLGAVPQMFIDNFMRADWGARYEMTIDLALPWYCQFIAGWESVRSRNPHFGTFLTYDQIANDCIGSVNAVLRSLDIEPRVDIAKAATELMADRPHANFNVGRSGRGRELLTPAQRERIDSTLAAFVPSAGATGSLTTTARQYAGVH